MRHQSWCSSPTSQRQDTVLWLTIYAHQAFFVSLVSMNNGARLRHVTISSRSRHYWISHTENTSDWLSHWSILLLLAVLSFIEPIWTSFSSQSAVAYTWDPQDNLTSSARKTSKGDFSCNDLQCHRRSASINVDLSHQAYPASNCRTCFSGNLDNYYSFACCFFLSLPRFWPPCRSGCYC